MSSRIKGLFASKKKKDERTGSSGSTGRSHSKDVFTSATALASDSSFATNTHANGSFISSTSAYDLHQGDSSVDLTLTPRTSLKQQQSQLQTTTTSSASKISTSSSSTMETGPMTTGFVAEGLALPPDDSSKTTANEHSSEPQYELRKEEEHTASQKPSEGVMGTPGSVELIADAHDNSVNKSHLSVNGGHRINVSCESSSA
ncbi:hypothetical protein BC939DRAFT_61915 [Gamsiella multidivaricata]|uniref:uncharacterized protein n=1 Tax=Gamsiella multidivaricata TaxID=101098 RepID=UPI00221F1AA7|nr:uncharacterized protein BC939DRAFT_61915 [Gamsiella multidivaricata]KAI7828630.1 hypothetical protein BC939DRAFT_61915 [Gamsiella multidivaricata]